MTEFEKYVLGVSDSELQLDSLAENEKLVLGLVQQASLALNIFTRNLDPGLFDHDFFADAVSSLARRSNRARIRILLMDEEPAIKYGHRLIDLARRLSSSIEIRIINEDYRHRNHAFVTVDNCGYSYRELADRNESISNFNDPGRTRELVDEFNEIWEHSHSSAELRRLHI